MTTTPSVKCSGCVLDRKSRWPEFESRRRHWRKRSSWRQEGDGLNNYFALKPLDFEFRFCCRGSRNGRVRVLPYYQHITAEKRWWRVKKSLRPKINEANLDLKNPPVLILYFGGFPPAINVKKRPTRNNVKKGEKRKKISAATGIRISNLRPPHSGRTGCGNTFFIVSWKT